MVGVWYMYCRVISQLLLHVTFVSTTITYSPGHTIWMTTNACYICHQSQTNTNSSSISVPFGGFGNDKKIYYMPLLIYNHCFKYVACDTTCDKLHKTRIPWPSRKRTFLLHIYIYSDSGRVPGAGAHRFARAISTSTGLQAPLPQ